MLIQIVQCVSCSRERQDKRGIWEPRVGSSYMLYVYKIGVCQTIQATQQAYDEQVQRGEHTMMKGEQVAQIAVTCGVSSRW